MGRGTISVLAGFQVLFLDREDRTGLNGNAVNDAAPTCSIGEFHVVASRRHAGNAQPLIHFDRSVFIVLALIGSPVRGARRRQMQFRNRVPGQVPKSRLSDGCCCGCRKRRNNDRPQQEPFHVFFQSEASVARQNLLTKEDILTVCIDYFCILS